MKPLQLETEIAKLTRAMMTRNSEIGKDLINHLRTQLAVEAIAGLLLISIERLIWFDTDSVVWTIEHLIPADVMLEIRRTTTIALYQQLIGQGFVPGKEFSMDANGKLLLNDRAKTAMLCR